MDDHNKSGKDASSQNNFHYKIANLPNVNGTI